MLLEDTRVSVGDCRTRGRRKEAGGRVDEGRAIGPGVKIRNWIFVVARLMGQGGCMKLSSVLVLAVLIVGSLCAGVAGAEASDAAGEYSRHFGALTKLSIAVAQAMPAEKYAFRPHPESMTFGELMTHIATTNYQFCAGLKDSEMPALPSSTDKDAIVKFLSDSFAYCAAELSASEWHQATELHGVKKSAAEEGSSLRLTAV